MDSLNSFFLLSPAKRDRDAWHASQMLRFLLIIIHGTCYQETHAMRIYGSI